MARTMASTSAGLPLLTPSPARLSAPFSGGRTNWVAAGPPLHAAPTHAGALFSVAPRMKRSILDSPPLVSFGLGSPNAYCASSAMACPFQHPYASGGFTLYTLL